MRQTLIFLIGGLLDDLDPLEGGVVEDLSPVPGTVVGVRKRRVIGRVGDTGDGGNTTTAPGVAQCAVKRGCEVGLLGSIRHGHDLFIFYYER